MRCIILSVYGTYVLVLYSLVPDCATNRRGILPDGPVPALHECITLTAANERRRRIAKLQTTCRISAYIIRLQTISLGRDHVMLSKEGKEVGEIIKLQEE